MQTIALVDLGMGNLRSVQRALKRAATDVGAELSVAITAEAEAIARADKVVVPGQGAFRDCAKALEGALGQVIRERIAAGTPYLGICLGLQAPFQSSEEAPGAAGLGVFEGEVQRLPEGAREAATGELVKIPHMGWNEVKILRPEGALAAFPGERPYLYFVHSYHAVPLSDHGRGAAGQRARDPVSSREEPGGEAPPARGFSALKAGRW